MTLARILVQDYRLTSEAIKVSLKTVHNIDILIIMDKGPPCKEESGLPERKRRTQSK
jgi:hypothetical protein